MVESNKKSEIQVVFFGWSNQPLIFLSVFGGWENSIPFSCEKMNNLIF